MTNRDRFSLWEIPIGFDSVPSFPDRMARPNRKALASRWRRSPVKRAHVTLTMLILVANVAVADGSVRECRWWLELNVQRQLALSDEQVQAIESSYRRTLTHRRILRRRLEAATAELTRAFARDDLSDVEAQALVNQVEDWRRQRNVARTQLLVALYFLLTPDQRARFSRLVDRGAVTVPPRC